MAPFRASRSTRSGRPGGQNEQDVFDGLPVRQWRFQGATVSAIEEAGHTPALALRGEGIWKEMPMPKGSEHYPIHSQQILREARLGRLVVSVQNHTRGGFGKFAREEDKKHDVEHLAEGTGEEKRVKIPVQGFVTKRWLQIPKHMEEPEVEHLAKRRKGLSSMHAKAESAVAPVVSSVALRRTRVRRVDDQGRTNMWEVLVPQGSPIDGEVDEPGMAENLGISISRPAPGTVIAGLGIANDDGIIVVSITNPPLVSIASSSVRPKGPRRKTRGGFRKGRGKKLGYGERGGVSASAEALYALRDAAMGEVGVTIPGEAQGTDQAVDFIEQEVGEEEEEESEGEVDEEDVEEEDGEAEPDDDEVDGDEDMDRDVNDDDREEGEITPSPEPPDITEPLSYLDVPPVTATKSPPRPAPFLSTPPILSQADSVKDEVGSVLTHESSPTNLLVVEAPTSLDASNLVKVSPEASVASPPGNETPQRDLNEDSDMKPVDEEPMKGLLAIGASMDENMVHAISVSVEPVIEQLDVQNLPETQAVVGESNIEELNKETLPVLKEITTQASPTILSISALSEIEPQTESTIPYPSAVDDTAIVEPVGSGNATTPIIKTMGEPFQVKPSNGDVHFPDGDIDLLGSLGRDLEQQSHTEAPKD